MWMSVRVACINVERDSNATICLVPTAVNARRAISMIHSEGCA